MSGTALQPPCVVISGFLGSGKTTLLQSLLDQAREVGWRIALIVNEVGEIAIDGRVVEGMEAIEKMVELSDGCVCCSIREYELQAAYQEIVTTYQAQLLLIETTGLADPVPVVARLRMVRAPVSAIIAVVDGVNYTLTRGREPVVDAQVQAADFLVLNKRDLLEDGEAAAVADTLRRVNQRARLIETVHGGLPLSLLLGLPARPAGVSPAAASPVSVPVWPGGLHPPELRGTGFTSLALRLPGRMRMALLRRLLDSLPAAVYRAKGVLVTVADDAPQLLSFVCGRWDVRDLPRLRDVMTETQLVLIGDGLGPLEAELRARFAACMEPGGAPLLPIGVRRP